jgi:hypothetical protein
MRAGLSFTGWPQGSKRRLSTFSAACEENGIVNALKKQ